MLRDIIDLYMCFACGNNKLNLDIAYAEGERKKIEDDVPVFIKKTGARIVEHILHVFTGKLADKIFYNGTIYTMNPTNPVVEAIAVKGKRILEAGDLQKVMTFNDGNKTAHINLNGKTLIPGFVEPHAHMLFAYFDSFVDLGPFVNKDMDEVRKRLIEAVEKVQLDIVQAQVGEEEPVIPPAVMCQLFDPLCTPGHFDVSRKELDAISSTIPIFILESNGHIGHVNSAAFAKAGITDKTEDPPHARFVRDADGHLTGQVQEGNALGMFLSIGPKVTPQDYLLGVKNIFKNCTSKGVTSFHDCGIGSIDDKLDYWVLHNVLEEEPPIRISGFLVSSRWDSWMEQGLVPQYRDEIFRINGVKAWADGSTQGGSAYLRSPYLKAEWGVGFPNYSQQQLNEAVLKAHVKGWQVGIHCNGDAAIDMALDAFENAQKNCKRDNMRHRTEHTTFCWEEQFARMKQLDVYPSFLIGHIYYYGNSFRDIIMGEERANLVDSCRTALKYDRRPSLHSDYNCQPIDPIRQIYNAVTRIIRNTGQVLNENECLTPEEAIRAVTLDAAFQCHMDDIVGSIQRSKMADFVVLSEDPMKIEKAKLLDIVVQETWFAGELVYARKSPK